MLLPTTEPRRRASRGSARRRSSRATCRPRARGGASARTRCRARRHACHVADGAVRALARRVAQDDLSVRFQPRESSSSANQQPSPCLTGIVSVWSLAQREVNGVSVRSTTEPTSRQTKERDALGRRAPGRRPASVRIWKPLQIPSTSPPVSAKASPRASPVRSERSRRSAGSRRTRTRPAGRRLPFVAAAPRRCARCVARRRRGRSARAGVAVVVRAGEDDDGDHRVACPRSVTRPPASRRARARSSRSAGSSAAARTCARAGRSRSSRSSVGSSTSTSAADARLVDREAEVAKRTLDRLALRVEDARLRADEHGCPHALTTSGSAR